MGRRRTPAQRVPEEPCNWYVCCADNEIGPMTEQRARANADLLNRERKCSWNHVAREGSALFAHLVARHGWWADRQPSHQHMVRKHAELHDDDQGLGHGVHNLTTKPDTRLEERLR